MAHLSKEIAEQLMHRRGGLHEILVGLACLVDPEDFFKGLDETEIRLNGDAGVFSAGGQNIVILLGDRAVEVNPIVGPRVAGIGCVGVKFKRPQKRDGATGDPVLALAKIERARAIEAVEQREGPIAIGSGNFLSLGPGKIAEAARQQGRRQGLPVGRFHDFGRQLENPFTRKVLTTEHRDELAAIETEHARLVVRHVALQRERLRIQGRQHAVARFGRRGARTFAFGWLAHGHRS